MYRTPHVLGRRPHAHHLVHCHAALLVVRGSVSRGRTILILGPCNAGKTALWLQVQAPTQRYLLSSVQRGQSVAPVLESTISCMRQPVHSGSMAHEIGAGFHCPELPWTHVLVVQLQLREGGPCQGTVASLQENEDTFRLADTKVHCYRAMVPAEKQTVGVSCTYSCELETLNNRDDVLVLVHRSHLTPLSHATGHGQGHARQSGGHSRASKGAAGL